MSEARPDFWLSSGYRLLTRDDNGRLGVTPDFVRAYFHRPEVAPVDESCDAERALHADLLADPTMTVTNGMLARLADPDARENYQHILRFRDHLLAHGTIEAAYLSLFGEGGITVPPLFLDQLAHAILRNILEDCDDPLRPRAAEVLFRSQKVTLRDGAILMADEETVEMYAATGGMGGLGQLLIENQTPTRQVDLDVLYEENGSIYWDRSDKFDTVLDMTFTRPGLDAFCRVLEAWVEHMLGATVRVQPVQSIKDERWVWHVGLEVEATGILNDLYEGKHVGEDRLARLISLFRLEFRDPTAMMPQIAGRPVYLGAAMTEDGVVRMKPQNLLFNLPLAAAA